MSSSSRLLSTSSIGFLGSKVFLRPSHPDDDRRSRSTKIVRQHHHITPFGWSHRHTDMEWGIPRQVTMYSHTQHNTQKQGTYPAGMLSLQIPQKSSRGWFFLARKCGVDSSTHRILEIPLHEHSGDARYGNGNSLSEDAAGGPKWSSHLTQSRFACFVVLVFRTRSTFWLSSRTSDILLPSW